MWNVPSDKTRDGMAEMGCTKEGSNITKGLLLDITDAFL